MNLSKNMNINMKKSYSQQKIPIKNPIIHNRFSLKEPEIITLKDILTTRLQKCLIIDQINTDLPKSNNKPKTIIRVKTIVLDKKQKAKYRKSEENIKPPEKVGENLVLTNNKKVHLNRKRKKIPKNNRIKSTKEEEFLIEKKDNATKSPQKNQNSREYMNLIIKQKGLAD